MQRRSSFFAMKEPKLINNQRQLIREQVLIKLNALTPNETRENHRRGCFVMFLFWKHANHVMTI